MTHAKIRQRLRRHVREHGSARALALVIGVSNTYVSEVLNGKREPGPRILAFLGLERHQTYRKKEE